MSISSVALILNPAAANGRAGRDVALVERALVETGIRHEVHLTDRPGQATELARALRDRFDAVLAAGGDGTVSEVAAGLIGTDTALGIVPLGTGNDLATLLGVPKRADDAVRALAGAESVQIDAGTVRWREAGAPDRVREVVFANAAGVGFDALVAAEAERLKRFRGISGYVLAVWKALRLWTQPEAEVTATLDGTVTPVYQGPIFAGSVQNGVSVGGGFRLTPDARVDDGLLDLCVIAGPLTVRRILTLLPKGIAGRHTAEPEVRMARAERYTFRLSEGVPIHADGEVLTRDAVEAEAWVRPGALRVLRPG